MRATLGPADARQLLAPTVRALADETVLVVATTGGKPIESLGAALDKLPPNARIESFVPHAHSLPHVDVVVTNAGYNGVQMALAHGVPLVAAGGTEDKPEVAARIAWAGVGVNLKTSTPSDAHIRQAVRQVLTDRRFRQRAREFSADIRRHDSANEAADLLERLIETGQPVLARRSP
jgi:UDP:flavonoid glycosyltransferase YjiC (YdhE family)